MMIPRHLLVRSAAVLVASLIGLNAVALSSSTKGKARKATPRTNEVYATIEDEDLILLPSDEVETVFLGTPRIRSQNIARAEKFASPPTTPQPKVAAPLKKTITQSIAQSSVTQSERKVTTSLKSLPKESTPKLAKKELSPEPAFASVEIPSTPVSNPNPPAEPESKPLVSTTPKSTSTITTTSITTTTLPSTTQPKYYQVEDQDINSLTYRMRIVQAILEESGRAYDYRSMKTKELVAVLNRVRQENIRSIHREEVKDSTPELPPPPVTEETQLAE
jgi:hypothetical protein